MSEQAGRELDAKVAERVMGLTRCDESYDVDGLGRVLRFVWRDVSGACVYTGDMFLPRYSTSIAAAWEVVSALEGKSMFLTLSRNQIPNDANGQQSKWDAYFWDNGRQMAHDVTAPTVPLAICFAALKAVGEGKS